MKIRFSVDLRELLDAEAELDPTARKGVIDHVPDDTNQLAQHMHGGGADAPPP